MQPQAHAWLQDGAEKEVKMNVREYDFFFLAAVGAKKRGSPRGREWMEILTDDGSERRMEKKRAREWKEGERRETNI